MSAGRLHGQSPHLDHPRIPNGADAEAGRTHAAEDLLIATTCQRKEESRAVGPAAYGSPYQGQKTTMVQLLRHQVLLLAMKNGRAPLPVSSSLWRGLLREGFLSDVYDLGSLARRLLFLEDGRILLAELKARNMTKPSAEEKGSTKNANEDLPPQKDEKSWPRD